MKALRLTVFILERKVGRDGLVVIERLEQRLGEATHSGTTACCASKCMRANVRSSASARDKERGSKKVDRAKAFFFVDLCATLSASQEAFC